MLKVKVIPRFGEEPTVARGNLVIVEDELGNPLVVAVRTSDRMTLVASSSDPDFNTLLRRLGINRVVINEPMAVAPPPEGAKKLDVSQIAGFIDNA